MVIFFSKIADYNVTDKVQLPCVSTIESVSTTVDFPQVFHRYNPSAVASL